MLFRMVYHSLILGAGQAGLAAAYYLRQAGVSFLVLEASEGVGNSWVHRYDSLRLFSPASYDALPGLVFPLPPECYPTKDEVAAYLRQYVAHHQRPVVLSEKAKPRFWPITLLGKSTVWWTDKLGLLHASTDS